MQQSPISGQAATGFLKSQAMQGVLMLVAFIALLMTVWFSFHPAQVHNARVAQCHPVFVTFSDDVPVSVLGQLLAGVHATIAYGPNAQGAFELQVVSGSASSLVGALNKASDMVVVASLNDACHTE